VARSLERDQNLDLPDKALVLCVGRTIPDPSARSHAARVAHAAREGRAPDPRLHAAWDTTLFAALDAKSGEILGEFHQRTAPENFGSSW